LAISIAGILLVTAPTYAHWGASSPWAFSANNDTQYCTHGQSGHADYRKVRLVATRAFIPLDVGGFIIIDNATMKNVSPSGNADVFVAGYDVNDPPGSFLPYLGTINNLARNASANFGSVVGATKLLFNLQATCETSDNML
jgi:hypothetical protein